MGMLLMAMVMTLLLLVPASSTNDGGICTEAVARLWETAAVGVMLRFTAGETADNGDETRLPVMGSSLQSSNVLLDLVGDCLVTKAGKRRLNTCQTSKEVNGVNVG